MNWFQELLLIIILFQTCSTPGSSTVRRIVNEECGQGVKREPYHSY